MDTVGGEFDLQCEFERNTDTGRVSVTMEWGMVPQDPLSLEAYTSFVIFAQFIDSTNPASPGLFTGFDFAPKVVSDRTIA